MSLAVARLPSAPLHRSRMPRDEKGAADQRREAVRSCPALPVVAAAQRASAGASQKAGC